MGNQGFVQVLQKLPLPVTVVTVGRGGAENGLTISWVCPASFDPPQLMFAVDRNHYSLEFLRSTKNFTVNVLKEGQQRVAGQFARQSMSNEDKLDTVQVRESETGSAILSDALSYFDCEVTSVHECGDHVIVVGAVVDAGILNDGQALTTQSSGLQYRKFGR